MRITNHPIHSIQNRKKISFQFNGETIEGLEGDTIASALWANGKKVFRYSEKIHEPRSMFCGIGNCYECRVFIKEVGMVKACITPIREGLVVSSTEEGE